MSTERTSTLSTPGAEQQDQRRVYLLLWSRLLTAFSAGLTALAYSYVAVRELESVESGAAVALTLGLGALVGNLVGGLADFYRPPKVLALASAAGTSGAVAAFIASNVGAGSIVPYLAAAFVTAGAGAVCSRAESAAVVHLVPQARFPRVFGMLAARAQIAGALAGATSGLLISTDVRLPFAIDLVAWLIGLGFAVALGRGWPRGPGHADLAKPTLSGMFDGFRLALAKGPIRTLIGISALANLFLEGVGTVIELDLLAGGTSIIAIGLLGTATNLSALAGSLVSGFISSRVPPRALFGIVLGVLAGAVIVVALTDHVVIIGAALACGVFLIPALGVTVAMTVARLTARDHQARVSGANAVISMISNGISPGVFGFGYARFAKLPVLAIAATGVLAAGATAVVRLRGVGRGTAPGPASP